MGRAGLSLGELVEHWTLVGDELELVVAKHADTRLAFALLLKFYGRYGRLAAVDELFDVDRCAAVGGGSDGGLDQCQAPQVVVSVGLWSSSLVDCCCEFRQYSLSFLLRRGVEVYA